MYKLRIILGLIAGLFLAVAIKEAFPSFPAGGMALITATGVALGVVWYAKAISKRLGLPEKPIVLSRPVEALSLWFFGIVYSSIWAGILGSYLLASVATVLSVLAVAVWQFYKTRRNTMGYYVYVAATMLSGMASLLIFARYATPYN
ncbi:hypothetical protein [Methylotenera sp.]|uniref:hypothetical protein n=1 Tax=Methylotenera sp. TaxID=2051956 RepID=UPI00248949DB|nr:hypothetical protein [Methylotenera sp.]MDI1363179.1 hypothetical protein [Methylotenera sp.]